ncbi:TonB-dependent siderophore receptor [Polymorphobacter sp. PAMC 29334]|uniref:TonB-dependent receptor plug domain-containing protein n=1 Tax=Polymorphobacter sp. PAMC 29334 TaxID=2862331 RepID=UPI001D01819D|nr:TonB-dependent receptor [Polymorphobacter sp. PAMC 29334]
MPSLAPAAVVEPAGTPAVDSNAAGPDESDIIVTGTRASGITAAESAAPIKVLDAETLQHVGQPNLNSVLQQLIPSFTAESFGGDTANLTLSARLRGLSPNHALVLVNGKRRHGTSNLHVLSGPFQGGAAPDLDFISPESIKRIEVLEDGAAAQYGSDAIAGVINIILKDDDEGISGNATGGQYYKTGGATYAGSLHFATKLGEDGFFNVTLFHRFHDFSQGGGLDTRVTDVNGVLRTDLSAAQQALYKNIPGFPYVNKINGDAKQYLTNAQFNSGYKFGNIEAYSFGSYSRRVASAYENLRVPDRVIASPVLGVGGTLTTPGELIFNPLGFNPREGTREDDFGITGGVKGELGGGFHFDLSTTYGDDKNSISTIDSANRSLFVDTHFTPTNFYDGFFRATEWTTNLDLTKEFDVGMATPLTIAGGAEYRRNSYQIGSGDPGSIYKEGGQSYPGFRPSDAGIHDRKNYAIYGDLSVSPVEKLKLDGAVRYEHYTDFGSTVTGKGTARYDFSDGFALRGTVSNGFRAPTLAEEYYSATNVSPTSAFVQLPANSAAAKLLGFGNLKPEKSTNFSFGTVIRPAPKLTFTIDAYQIRIRDRILGTGTVYSSGGGTDALGRSLNFPVVQTAIVANGNILDPTVTQTGVNIFTNGATTRTRGIDVVASYASDFESYGTVNWTVSGNYNETKLTRVGVAPVQLTPVNAAGAPVAGGPIALFDKTSQSLLEDGSPKVKIVGSAFWSLDRFSATVRETFFGTTSALYSPDGGTYFLNRVGPAFISDVELNARLTRSIQLSVGANNLFNRKAPTVTLLPNGTGRPAISNGGNVFDAPLGITPYGTNGGYYYARLNFAF